MAYRLGGGRSILLSYEGNIELQSSGLVSRTSLSSDISNKTDCIPKQRTTVDFETIDNGHHFNNQERS